MEAKMVGHWQLALKILLILAIIAFAIMLVALLVVSFAHALSIHQREFSLDGF